MEDDSDEEASPLERGDRNDEMSIFARFFL